MQDTDCDIPGPELALKKAKDEVGGGAALAELLGISPQAVSQWKKVPADRVIQVEKATGGKVPRTMLRPDIYPAEEAAA